MRGYCTKPEWAEIEPCPIDTEELEECDECAWYENGNLEEERDALIKQVPHDPEKQGQWISVNDRMPKAEERVLVCVENKYAGKTYKNVVTGMHEDGTVYREDSDWMFNDFDELRTYDEEKDDWIIPEGWWEYTLYNDENENYRIDGNVTHWMPIPEPPQEEPHEP